MRKWLTVLIPALCVFLGDQWLKAASAGQSRVLIPGALSLRYTENTGFSLGLFPDTAVPAIVLSCAVLAVALWFLIRERWETPSLLAFGLLLGGAAGNLWDRLRFGFVRDMLHLDFMHFYVFNLADACVVAGAALILLFSLFSRKDA